MTRALFLLVPGLLLLAWSSELFLSSSSPIVTALAVVVLCLGVAFAGAGVAVGVRAMRNL